MFEFATRSEIDDILQSWGYEVYNSSVVSEPEPRYRAAICRDELSRIISVSIQRVGSVDDDPTCTAQLYPGRSSGEATALAVADEFYGGHEIAAQYLKHSPAIARP